MFQRCPRLTATYFLFVFVIIFCNFLFWYNFKLTKKLQDEHKEFPCIFHPDSPVISIVPRLLSSSFSIHVSICNMLYVNRCV